jgi:hypothetical protein
MEEITEKLLEKILDRVKQKVHDVLKKFLVPKSKEHAKTQKQINELRDRNSQVILSVKQQAQRT